MTHRFYHIKNKKIYIEIVQKRVKYAYDNKRLKIYLNKNCQHELAKIIKKSFE